MAKRYMLDGRVVILGVSMGGYGALKIAFAQPEAFTGVAVVEPMLEPSLIWLPACRASWRSHPQRVQPETVPAVSIRPHSGMPPNEIPWKDI